MGQILHGSTKTTHAIRAEQAGCGSSPQAVEGCTALH